MSLNISKNENVILIESENNKNSTKFNSLKDERNWLMDGHCQFDILKYCNNVTKKMICLAENRMLLQKQCLNAMKQTSLFACINEMFEFCFQNQTISTHFKTNNASNNETNRKYEKNKDYYKAMYRRNSTFNCLFEKLGNQEMNAIVNQRCVEYLTQQHIENYTFLPLENLPNVTKIHNQMWVDINDSHTNINKTNDNSHNINKHWKQEMTVNFGNLVSIIPFNRESLNFICFCGACFCVKKMYESYEK